MIKWENGELISPAKVNEDGTITSAVYSGKTPLIAENLNLMQEEILNETNSKIENLEKYNIYSENETKIGKWIDGSDIYRKVIINTTKEASYSIEHHLNIKNLIDLKGCLKQAGDTMLPFGFFTLYNGNEMYVSAAVTPTNINVRTSEEYKDSTKIIILEYLKNE